MDVDFLPPEFQREALAVAEGFQRHPQYFGIEADDRIRLGRGHYKVVKAVDHQYLRNYMFLMII
jgi:hypothetical protein